MPCAVTTVCAKAFQSAAGVQGADTLVDGAYSSTVAAAALGPAEALCRDVPTDGRTSKSLKIHIQILEFSADAVVDAKSLTDLK